MVATAPFISHSCSELSTTKRFCDLEIIIHTNEHELKRTNVITMAHLRRNADADSMSHLCRNIRPLSPSHPRRQTLHTPSPAGCPRRTTPCGAPCGRSSRGMTRGRGSSSGTRCTRSRRTSTRVRSRAQLCMSIAEKQNA